MSHRFDMILTDYMPLFGYDCEVEPIAKGDAKAMCIAAASIIAKEAGINTYALDMAMSGNSYFTAMYHNINTLKEALQ